MPLNKELAGIVNDTLNLGDRIPVFAKSTQLNGAIPELDSMGVVSLVAAFEERFGITIHDQEIDGTVFQTFGSLVAFVEKKLKQA